MPPKQTDYKDHSRFFEHDPTKWTIIAFLSYKRHPRAWDSRRKILNAWVRELEDIISCWDDRHDHEDRERERAQSMLDRYREIGSVDRRYGQDWLKCQKPGRRPLAPAPAPAPAPALAPTPSSITYAPVFHSSGSAALFQSGGSVQVYNHLPVDKSTTPAGDDNIDSDSSLPPSDRLELGEEDTSEIGVGVGYEEEAAEDDRPDHDIANDNEDSEICPPHIEEFNSAFLKTEGHRWCLSGGRDVETILHQGFYKVGHKGFYANLARSFILDLGEEDNDSDTRHVNVCRGWFSTEEWAEIMTTVPGLSQAVAIPLFKSLDRFDAAKTKAELRQRVCSTRFKPDDEPFVRDVHYDLWSADLAVQNVLGHWEDPNQPLRAPQLEDSLSSALWAPIIDHPLRGLRGVQMVHKESCCTSTASRRCRLRTETSERQASGPKIDGIIRSIEDDSLEFGSMEVSKSWGGVGGKSTKRLGDINKVIKSLRDMLFELHKRVGFNPAATKNIQVVGIICCGLKVQFFRMYGKGHIAILKREAIETVPIECSNFKDLKRLIVKFAMIKNVIAQSMTTVRECRGTTPDQTDEARLDALLFGCGARGFSGPKLGRGADTPPRGW